MGGAKNCPETPRQKMIGMMYLVLTAMLALNVSTDILNGFKLVDDSLHFSIEGTEHRNEELMNEFRIATEHNPEKNQAWYNLALEMNAKADSLYDYIQEFKYNIAELADGAEKAAKDPEVRNVEGTSNLDVTGQYGLNDGNGAILKEKIASFKDYIILLSDSTKTKEYSTIFATPEGHMTDGTPISWEASIFEGMPVGATITLLTKMQNDVRAAQGSMIRYLRARTDASDMRVNKMKAFVIPESKYVIQGGTYSAEIVLAAIDTTSTPLFFVGGRQIGSDGVYKFTASALGTHTYSGEVVLRGLGGETRYPFKSEYRVGEPSATVSNLDLNIMYRDYDNKFSISVPGVSADKVRVTVTNGTIREEGNLWLIRPGSGNLTKICVEAVGETGAYRKMGEREYRVKPLPKPGAYFKTGAREIEEGNITRAQLLNKDATIIASYGPDGLLDLKYTITSFTVRTQSSLRPAKGNKFTQQQIRDLEKLNPGAIVNIVEIKAINEGGKEVSLRSIPLVLN